MTGEKAIETLSVIKAYEIDNSIRGAEDREAIDMAIKALEQESCKDKPFVINKLKDEDIQKLLREFQNQNVMVTVAEHDCLPSVTTIEPCEDAISREAVLDLCDSKDAEYNVRNFKEDVECLPPVAPQPKIGHCKDCKYFEYDSVAKVDGIPLIVAHEICSRWGDGCKTKEDGYCFLFEQKMQEVEE